MPKEPNNDKTWTCSICGYKYVVSEPPKKCPVCKADGVYSAFVEE